MYVHVYVYVHVHMCVYMYVRMYVQRGSLSLSSPDTGGSEDLLDLFEREGGWKSELGSPDGNAVPEFPARRTRLLQIPITVSLMGKWSTLNRRTGSYIRTICTFSHNSEKKKKILFPILPA